MGAIEDILSWLACHGKVKALEQELEATKQSLQVSKRKAKQGVKDRDAMLDLHLKESKRFIIEVAELQRWVRLYQQLWKAGLHIPDLKAELKSHTVYVPRDDPEVMKYARVLNDVDYYAYPLAKWTEDILPQLHRAVKDNVPKWIRDVSDCDNFADVMHAAVQLAFISAGKKKQAAFGKCYSKTHAYNFFVTSTGEAYIYEPQNGEIKGKLGETGAPWDTNRLYMTG